MCGVIHAGYWVCLLRLTWLLFCCELQDLFVLEMEAVNLAEAIADLDRQERLLTLELKDVLTDIATPEVSDTEADNEDIEETDLANVRDSLMQVDSFPRRYTEYSELYQRAEYRLKAKLKVRFAKKLLKSVRLAPLMAGPNLTESLDRVKSTYPDDGGREGINLLVAIHNIVIEN
jgi:hypothetical protein